MHMVDADEGEEEEEADDSYDTVEDDVEDGERDPGADTEATGIAENDLVPEELQAFLTENAVMMTQAKKIGQMPRRPATSTARQAARREEVAAPTPRGSGSSS